jgi:tetratricopeptide (TPR) repeat protein
MNDLNCFMNRLSCALLCVIFSVSGCTVMPATPQSAAPKSGSESASEPAAAEPQKRTRPTDTDVMYHVFSAELLGARGDFSAAAAAYLEAALASPDPEIAERATRVALAADEWQLVALASDRWAMLAPDNLDAHQLAAGSRLREGDYAGAEYQLGKILEMTADNPAHGWRIVSALLVPADDQSRANKVLDDLLRKFNAKSNADAYFARSQLAVRAGDMDKAEKMANEAIGLAPERADLLAWAGRLAISRNHQAMALARYRQAWDLDHANVGIAMAYAELLKRSGDKAGAEHVMAQLPDVPGIRFSRIVLALEMGERDRAEKLYRGFSEAHYKDASAAAFQAAQSAEMLDHPRQAIEWYKQVTGERSLQAVLRQAFLLAGIGQIEEARNTLAQIRINTDKTVQADSYQAEAQILQDAGRRQEALEVLNHALKALPDSTNLRYARALLSVDMGKLKLAEADLRQIIAVEPDNAAALNALGYTLADLTQRYDEAAALIHKAYALQPQEPSIIDSMGWIAYRQGRLQEAVRYLDAAWQASKNAEIAAHLGEVLWQLDQKDKARAMWQAGLKLEPDNAVLAETMQRFGVSP